jgi:hypothetical protein
MAAELTVAFLGAGKMPTKRRKTCLLIQEKKGLATQKRMETLPVLKKTEPNWKKRLANLWRRVKVKKKAHAGRGQEIKWEIPVENADL